MDAYTTLVQTVEQALFAAVWMEDTNTFSVPESHINALILQVSPRVAAVKLLMDRKTAGESVSANDFEDAWKLPNSVLD